MPTAYSNFTVTSTAQKIISADPQRKGMLLSNESSTKIYIGPDESITSSNAVSIPAFGNLNNSGLAQSWRGDIYGITASGTADIRYWTWTQ